MPGCDPTALLPVAAAFAGASDLGVSAPFEGVPGGTALLPVAPGLSGGSLAEVEAPGLAAEAPAGPAFDDGATGAEDFEASAPVAALSGSDGFGVAEAGEVAVGGTALLPVEPGLAGAELGLAAVSDGLPDATGLAPGPDAAGFVEAAPDAAAVALGPGLAGAELGPADLSDALPEDAV